MPSDSNGRNSNRNKPHSSKPNRPGQPRETLHLQNKQGQQPRPANKPNLQEFFDSLKPGFLKPAWNTSYTPMDRFRDYHAVFDSETGRRVLAQIIDMCEGKPITLNQVGDHAYLAFRQGMREVGMNIVVVMNNEPNDFGMKDDD